MNVTCESCARRVSEYIVKLDDGLHDVCAWHALLLIEPDLFTETGVRNV